MRIRRAGLLIVAAFAVVMAPAVAAAAPTGYVTYEAQDDVQLGSVDLGAGSPTLTNIGATGIGDAASVTGLAMGPDGLLYAIDVVGSYLYVLNPATGAVVDSVLVDAELANSQPAVTAAGRVFLLDGNALLEVEFATGAVTPVKTLPAGMQGIAACTDASGTEQLVVNSATTEETFLVDATTFAVTTLPQTLGIDAVNSPKLAFDTDGTLWALNINLVTPSTFTIDTLTGLATTVGSTKALNAAGLAIAEPGACPALYVPAPAPAPVELEPAFTG